VRLGVQHESGNSSSEDESSSSDKDQGQSPGGQQGNDRELSLLSSVGEVVVSGVHVVESSGGVHLDQTSIEVGSSSVQLHAVSLVLVDGSDVVVVGSQELSHGQASSLSEHSHVLSQFRRLEQGSIGVDPIGSGGSRGGEVSDLDHVGSISLIGSFSGVSSGVGVATGPLEVDVISNSALEMVGDEVVLRGGVSLNDVSSLSSDVEVENSVGGGDSSGSGSDVEHVRSILEGSSELRSIDGEGHVGTRGIESGVLSDWGSKSVGGPVNESG